VIQSNTQLIISAVKASRGGGGGDNDKKGKELAKGDEIKDGFSTTVNFN